MIHHGAVNAEHPIPGGKGSEGPSWRVQIASRSEHLKLGRSLSGPRCGFVHVGSAKRRRVRATRGLVSAAFERISCRGAGRAWALNVRPPLVSPETAVESLRQAHIAPPTPGIGGAMRAPSGESRRERTSAGDSPKAPPRPETHDPKPARPPPAQGDRSTRWRAPRSRRLQTRSPIAESFNPLSKGPCRYEPHR